jgi:hypothetical protein
LEGLEGVFRGDGEIEGREQRRLLVEVRLCVVQRIGEIHGIGSSMLRVSSILRRRIELRKDIIRRFTPIRHTLHPCRSRGLLSILRQIELEREIVVQVHLLIHLIIFVAHFQLLLVP